MNTLDVARAYLDHGISLIPIATDGTKRPDGLLLPREQDPDTGHYRPSWRPFQQRLATPGEAADWWGAPKPAAMAAVCGTVSGGLECIDFDRGELLAEYMALVDAEDEEILMRLPRVRTPRQPPGYHIWLRSPARPVAGNAKLASDPALPAGERTLVETRGEGGYALVPGCPRGAHQSGRPYLRESGPPVWDCPQVTPQDRELLLRCARLFDRTPAAPDPLPARTQQGDDLLPGSDYDRRGPAWDALLVPHGWQMTGRRGQELRWRRPGKDAPGWSATTGHCAGKDGADLLRVFSSNAHPFQDGKAYGKFRARALLEFGGDLGQCAKQLAREGYGSPLGRAARRVSGADVQTVLAVCRQRPAEVLSLLLSCPDAPAMLREALAKEK